MRLRLRPETAEMAFQCAEDAGLNINAWFELMIKNALADGTILRHRKERDIQISEMRRFMNALVSLERSPDLHELVRRARNAIGD
jgi:hypothetical protein